jgi:hypothetical protein
LELPQTGVDLSGDLPVIPGEARLSSTPQNQQPPPDSLLFRIAFARARPCYCYGCICLTPEERQCQRRVFRMARAWARMLKAEKDRQN